MKKILSVLVFTLFCVGGVFAKSTVKVTVKLSSTSTDMGYVTYSTSTTTNETYTSTSDSKENSSSGGLLGWGATPTTPYYIFARTADSQKYYFIGWSKDVDDPSQIDTSIPRNGHQVGGAYAHGDNITVNDTYYAHFKEIQKWNIVLAQVVRGGSYSVNHSVAGVGKNYDVTTTSGNVNIPEFTDPAAANLTLKATAETDYRFLRWCIDYGDGKPVYDNRTNPTLTIAQSATISCEFINKDYAQFVLKGKSKVYYKLSEAIADAAATSSIIVVKESGTLYEETESTTYYDVANKKYTIPDNVTLLVPCNAAYDYRLGPVQKEDFAAPPVDGSGAVLPFFTCYKWLTIPSGITLSFKGDLSVYAKLSHNGTFMAYIMEYGQIHLCDGSKIELQSGAIANVFGYITGDHEKTEVIANEGSTVYEVMQVADWRGGSGTTKMLGKDNPDVFPINNYYCQNIETSLVIKKGAYEYVSTGVEVSTLGIFAEIIFTNIPFIVPTGGNENSGLIRQDDGAILTKYYNRAKDRMVIKATSTVLDKPLEIGNVVLNLSGYEMMSEDYVFPFAPNLTLILNNITAKTKYPVALLAGAEVMIDNNSFLEAAANVFIYDADQNNIDYPGDNDGNLAIGTYGYFDDSNAKQMKLQNYPSYPSGLVTPTVSRDAVMDAKIDVNGVLKGKLYTTSSGAAIVSSQGTGTVQFENLSSITSTNQALQYYKGTFDNGIIYQQIPITPAKLLNGDDSYSAGTTADLENDQTYKYYPQWNNGEGNYPGRWAKQSDLPQGTISATDIQGNDFKVKIPEPTPPARITFTPSVSGSEIQSIGDITFASDSKFAKKGNPEYSLDKATIAVGYTPTDDHGMEISESVIVDFNCRNLTSGAIEVLKCTIPLTASQNYQPAFCINGTEDETITLTFPETKVGQTSSVSRSITVTPVEGNVTDPSYNAGNGYVTWNWNPETLSASSPFEVTSGDYFEGASIVYKPTTTAGNHTQTLTITAKYKYSDGVEEKKTIILKGEPLLAPNPLKFEYETREIYPGDVINPLFSSVGNGETITFTYNEKETSDIVEVVKVGDNYHLQVKSGVNIITQQVIQIKATQPANYVTSEGSTSIEVTVTPSVQWNWSKLYFGATYDNPIVVKNDDDPWTLTYNNDCAAIPAVNFTGDATNGYHVQVGTGNEGTATFTFAQGSYTYTFESNVYADPRVLDVCLRDENAPRTYTDITVESTNVKYEDGGIVFATTETSGAAWTMTLVGVPDKLEFVPQGEGKKWTIQEYDGESWATTYAETEISLAEGQEYFTHNLKASTQQIRVICSLGATQGKITDLCVYALDASASANTEKLYMPIVNDENGITTQSQKSVVLSYVSPSSYLKLSVVDGSGNVVSDITLSGDNLSESDQLPATDVNNLYREETIVVSSTHSTEGVAYLLVKDKNNEEMLKLPIQLYEYPQPLPIRTADWKNNNAEKYYFYTDFEHSQNVQFNAVTQKLTFASMDNAQRFITLAFRGGPSYISFESSLDFVPQDDVTPEALVLQEWYDYWTLEITDGEFPRLVAKNAEAEVQPEIVAEVREGKTFYQIRIAIPYTTKSLTLQSKRSMAVEVENLVIDGEPDLDVVLGNHTIEHESKVNFNSNVAQQVMVTAINLETLKVACNNPAFVVSCGESSIGVTPVTLTAHDCPRALGTYMVGNITFDVQWKAEHSVDEGLLIFTDKDGNQLATIRLLGAKDYILKDNADQTMLYTGFAEQITSHPFTEIFEENANYAYERRMVDLSNTFDESGIALFDYLIVYGETSTTDLSTEVTAPTGANIVEGVSYGKGSNAKTPYYIYHKAKNSDGVYDRYQFVYDVENANVSDKPALETAMNGSEKLIPHAEDQNETKCIQIAAGKHLSVYVTGFCPYATTGYKKEQEGVWLFRGKPTAQLDLYLEDCHIYSRNKTAIGCSTGKFDFDVKFEEDYARGSGGVFVFECNSEGEFMVPKEEAFKVNIHTRGKNVLKSNFGTFYQIFGMRAYQVSSPISVHMSSAKHIGRSRTHLTFDDVWQGSHTNGFLSLQKLENNAPSIDLGNPFTVVDFRGGQVELQNAQNVSDKYKTTLAISYRSGIMAAGGIELQMAYGIGTDAATEGTVNFYDGTITVIPMWVKESERKYYLMDEDDPATTENESEWTSCLRCPQNTFVYGGSIGMLRACMSPMSTGGAPTDGNKPLGRFIYSGEEYDFEYNTPDKQKPALTAPAEQWLVYPKDFLIDEKFGSLSNYYTTQGYKYGLSSVTPDEKNNLTLWIPEGYGDVEVELDRKEIAWKSCMTEIVAALSTYEGRIGGDVSVENIETVHNLLYCHLDDYTHAVVSDHSGTIEEDNIVYNYYAPVKTPDNFQMDGITAVGDYMYLNPIHVGDKAYNITNVEEYQIADKVYYITTALSDTWMNFTMPFDVENIYVVESYKETEIEKYFKSQEASECDEGPYHATRMFQARHNADFASFFGAAMALGSEESFVEIKDNYLDWAYLEDSQSSSGKYEGTRENYDWRGIYPLTHYDGSNLQNAHFYLYENNGDWVVNDAVDQFTTQWTIAPAKSKGVLMHKERTYSMLFPDRLGIGMETDDSREFWDYWTGKFLIFESTMGPHILSGTEIAQEELELTATEGNATLLGNISFSKMMETDRNDLLLYKALRSGSRYEPLFDEEENEYKTIYPTNSLLHVNVSNPSPIMHILRSGEIIYDQPDDDNNGNQNGTSGHMPTVGGGNDLFITSIAGGINVAVAAPQNVRVLSSTGAVIYSGYVTTAVDIQLPTTGIYIVSGENEVQKILF